MGVEHFEESRRACKPRNGTPKASSHKFLSQLFLASNNLGRFYSRVARTK